jgi:hypothetical protein
VQPHSGLLHVTGLDGGLVMRPVTSVSKTQVPASAPDDPPPEEPLEEPLEEALDEAPELPEEPEPPELSDKPLSPVVFGPLPLLLPHPVAMRPTIAAPMIAVMGASEPQVEGLMCRYHSRPGWAS